MARVTVGLPVFNGLTSIRGALESLSQQDFDDFEVLVSDNASTDGTSEICQEFCEKHRHFIYFRHQENIGMVQNFFWVRDQAQSPLFAWRAHDDWSSADYLSRLVGCFDSDPDTRLAVGAVVTRSYRANGEPRIKRFPGPENTDGFFDRYRYLYGARASWIYGLWDREALIDVSVRIWENYPDVWGYDHLCVASTILDGQLRGDPKAEFTQHMDQRPRDHTIANPTPAQMMDQRRRFSQVLSAEIGRQKWNPFEALAWKLLVPTYMDHRIYHRRRIYKNRLRHWLGGGQR